MRNINDICTFVQYIVRKERGVFISFDQICTNLDVAQLNVLEDYFKMYAVNQIIHDAIKNFRVYLQFTTNASGFLDYESDYLHLLGNPFTVSGSTINALTIVNEDEFVSALTSQLRPTTITRPLAKHTSTGLSLYPQVVQTGFYNYLRRPATPNLVYVQSGRTIVYDPVFSTQLEWGDNYINAIISKSLSFAGINMAEPEINQFAQQFNQESE